MLINSTPNYYNNYALNTRQDKSSCDTISNISYLGKYRIMGEAEKKYSQISKEFDIDKAVEQLRTEIQCLPDLMDSLLGDSVIYLLKNCEINDFVAGYKGKTLDLIHKITTDKTSSYNTQFNRELSMIKDIYAACLDFEKNNIDKKTFDTIVEQSISKYCKTEKD